MRLTVGGLKTFVGVEGAAKRVAILVFLLARVCGVLDVGPGSDLMEEGGVKAVLAPTNADEELMAVEGEGILTGLLWRLSVAVMTA